MTLGMYVHSGVCRKPNCRMDRLGMLDRISQVEGFHKPALRIKPRCFAV